MLKDFYTNDGVVRMKLEKNEMLTRTFLPETMAGWQGAYMKLRIRGSIDYPLAGVAVAIKKNGVVQDAQAAITGVNPAPHLIPNVADALRGKAMKEDAEHNATVVGELAVKVARPLTTSALTPDYRREMIRVFAKRAVLAAVKA
jgi:4-hydroxybenzoyl-CoA reductase subunit beta